MVTAFATCGAARSPAPRWGPRSSPATAPTCTPSSSCAGTSTFSTAQARADSGAPERVRGRAGVAGGDLGLPPRRPGRRRLRRLRLPAACRTCSTRPSREPVQSLGLPAPWYAVYGNHDTLLLGTFDLTPQLRALAVGGQKAFTLEATASTALLGVCAAGQPAAAGRSTRSGSQLGTALRLPAGHQRPRALPLRAARLHGRALPHRAARPGPVGHGFTQHNLDTGETWWKTDLTPQVRAFGLDTCNQVAGPDGAVPDDQFRWLEAELETAQAEQRLVLLLSHHNSLTLENRATPARRPSRCTAPTSSSTCCCSTRSGRLAQRPHPPQPDPRPRTRGTGGFWEITTASCIDFPQQQQVVELVDNRDGTLSIFTTVVDHASPALARLERRPTSTWPRRAGSSRPTTGRRRR